MNNSYLWLAIGLVCLILGVFLVAEFIIEFAKLIGGLILIVIGMLLITMSRASARIIVR